MALVDTWTVDELVAVVGSIDRAAAIKALTTWVDLGVLKDEGGGLYRLLEVAEDGSATSSSVPRPGTLCVCGKYDDDTDCALVRVVEEVPAVLTVEQQQAEQMKVYWKVCARALLLPGTDANATLVVHRGHAHESRDAASGSNTNDAEVRAGVRPDDRAAGSVHGGSTEGGPGHGLQWYVEAEQTLIVRRLGDMACTAEGAPSLYC